MAISHADMDACGIPFRDHTRFRDYVRQRIRENLDELPPNVSFSIVYEHAKAWRQEEAERNEERGRKIAQSMDVAAQDRQRAEEQDRRRRPPVRADEAYVEPEEVGAVPNESPLPPRRRPRRRRPRK